MLRMTLSMVHGCWPLLACDGREDEGHRRLCFWLSTQLSLGSWLVDVGNSIRSKQAGLIIPYYDMVLFSVIVEDRSWLMSRRSIIYRLKFMLKNQG